ncbi:MAG: DUF2281 domain-containing protein [Phormidesmis sp.]
MSPLSEQILQNIAVMPEEDQRQILDFVEFLKAKRQKIAPTETDATPRSFLETAQAAIGMGEGPGDLSTNSVYMQGYGQ